MSRKRYTRARFTDDEKRLSRANPEIIGAKKSAHFDKRKMAADGPNEFKLENPPPDGISSLKFSPVSSNFLLVSSWDTVSKLFPEFSFLLDINVWELRKVTSQPHGIELNLMAIQ